MDFKAATDLLTQGPSVTLAKIADQFGVQLATIARARIDTSNRRPPPGNWEPVIADIAAKHAAELQLHIDALLDLSEKLRNQ